MQRDTIAFRVQDDCTKSVRAYPVDFLHNGTSVLRYLRNGVPDSPIDIHVDQDALAGGNLIFFNHQAATISVLVIKYRKAGIGHGLFRDIDCENRGIEFNRSVEVRHGDVDPYDAVVFAVIVTHRGKMVFAQRFRDKPRHSESFALEGDPEHGYLAREIRDGFSNDSKPP